MGTPREDFQAMLEDNALQWELPDLYYENWNYAVSAETTIRKGLELQLGGKTETIELSLIVSVAEMTGHTGDSTYYPDAPVTGDQNKPPPNIGKVAKWRNVSYKIVHTQKMGDIYWQIDLAALSAKGAGAR
jgi:hypothetical protein